MSAVPASLIAKYDVAGPRYTSYPTVPYWDRAPTETQWLERVGAAMREAAGEPRGAALYIHVPFCRSLCTYCGCNTRITRTHAIVMPYVNAVLTEYRLYRERLGIERPRLSEVHIGGGTPTFLDLQELEALLSGILGASEVLPDAALSVEVDPRVTTTEQLQLLARYGFRRISLGVQDFDPKVQQIVNRAQSVEQVRAVTAAARVSGFDSVNFDLIYGLPLQQPASIDVTMEAVCQLRPDRIAFYGYAHVPWIKPGQRRFTEADLPEGDAKRALYERGRGWLERAGYREVGFDHFALETDSLWRAVRSGGLYRNFMGYTDSCTRPLLGLGVSAIGDAGDAFAQNEKELQPYQERLARGELPLTRGHLLDAEDQVLRRHILSLMTRLATRWDGSDYTPYLDGVAEKLSEFAADGLVELGPQQVRITEPGRAFLRGICMAFDARLARRSPDKALFSRTV